jgi:hypothetical protein
MGLDMFIYRRNRGEEVAYWRKANAILKWIENNVVDEDEELENCKEYYLTKENLIALKEACLKGLSKPELEYKSIPCKEYDYDTEKYVTRNRMYKVLKDSSLAEELLPTQAGFFYGSTIYDQRYLDDLKLTVDQIDKILETTDFDNQELAFHAWW